MTNRGNKIWAEFNFISSNVTEEDKELFFGPLTGEEEFIVMEDNWSLPHVLHAAGIFPSVVQARKNQRALGHKDALPEGFTELVRGKNRNRKKIFILNKK